MRPQNLWAAIVITIGIGVPSAWAIDFSPAGWQLSTAVWSQSRPKSANRPFRRGRIVPDAAAEAQGSTDPAAIESFQKLVTELESGLTERGKSLPELKLDAGKVVALVDKAHLGYFYQPDGPTRFLAIHLRLHNATPQPLTIARKQITATIDGQDLATTALPDVLRNHGFQYAGDHFPLQAIQLADEILLPADGVTGAWLVYSGLGAGPQVPTCRLKLDIGEQTLTVDVTACQRAVLGLSTRRLGPGGCLAYLQISGLMNTFNLQSLVEELDALTSQKVQRAVISWAPDAPQPDGHLLAWLQNSALQVGTGRSVSEQLPSLPSALRELHLVQFASGGFAPQDFTAMPQGPSKVHTVSAEAVAAALRTALLTTSSVELRQQIQTGDVLSRAAALEHGAVRLAESDLPLLFALCADSDPILRRAALHALGDFSEPAAIERLQEFVRGDDAVAAAAATEALADSRFPAARDALRQLLTMVPEVQRDRILTVLAQRPRPDWSSELFRHVNQATGRPRSDVLRALVQLEHPQVVDLLEQSLKGSDPALRDFVFPILAQRTDERSEQLATDFVLTRLNEAPPDSQMIEFLNRAKDIRAVPAILRHLERASDKVTLIKLLGQIGDEKAGTVLAERMSQLRTPEQVETLSALRQLRHERYFELACRALASPDFSLVDNSARGLAQDGRTDAIPRIAAALEVQKHPQSVAALCNALAAFATSEARAELLKQRGMKDELRRKAALFGLQQLRLRSPGFQYVQQGIQNAQQREWAPAFEFFSLAIQLDPLLPEAYAGRGDVHLKQEKWAEAGADFGKAYELDPYSGLACSGSGIALVMQGQLDEGLKTVESARERFAGDVNYFYNAACVYGRAIEQIRKQPESPERDAKLQKFQTQALADLKESTKLGFDDMNWMREDADLKSLRDLPEFQTISQGTAEK